MTLYNFSSSQQMWLINSLFNFATKNPLFQPTHIFYFIDRNTNTDGVFFLKKGKKGIQYIFNTTNPTQVEVQLYSEQQTAEMIGYIESKRLPHLPLEAFEDLKREVLICQG